MEFLLDVYPHPTRSSLVVWAKRGSGTWRTEVPYRPDFCLQSEGKPLSWAEAELRRDRRVESMWRATTRPAPGAEPVEVLRVRPWSLHDVWAVASDLRKRAHTKGYLFFDVDNQPESRWMHANGLFPLCRLADDGSLRRHSVDERFDYDFPTPPLTIVDLEAYSHAQGVERAFDDPLDRIVLDGKEFACAGPDDEPRVLRQMGRLLRSLDPDVLVTRGGDEWDVPYLLSRIRAHSLQNEVWLGRAPDPDPKAPDQEAKSVSTYGRILYRTTAYYLRGRFHVDMGKKSLVDLPDRADLWGLVYMTRISNRRLQDVNRNGPGYCLQQIQIDVALDEGCSLPWKRNLSEDWKDAATLTAVDRGGQIMKPRPGIYGDVWALDFSAYYPSIVVGRNLSSDTINCACCPDSDEVIPDLGYHVCQKRGDGHQVKVLRPTVEHRRKIKMLLKRAKNQGTAVAEGS
ncbi:MAG TPA: DNA polymerase domain-containing protein [Candidatus Thermoplasmatota archaeon]|nr:DNA polymerase domain-containing protein [Candidatus Thermoplasmatota archaeon]